MPKKNEETTPEVVDKLVWRLGNKPTVDEVVTLLEKGVINKEEAKEILFRLESEEKTAPTTIGEVKKEVEFLRGMILKLMEQGTTNTTIYKYVTEPKWNGYNWTSGFVHTTQAMPKNTIMCISPAIGTAAGGTLSATSGTAYFNGNNIN